MPPHPTLQALQELVQGFLRYKFPGFNADVSAYPSQVSDEILILIEGSWGNVLVSVTKVGLYTLLYLIRDVENLAVFQKIQQAIQPFYEKVMVRTSWERLLGDDPFQPDDRVAETEPAEGYTALDRVLNDPLAPA